MMLRLPRRIAHPLLAGGVLACGLLLYSTAAWPQANSATFYGSVTDPTGAVVPAAVVSLIAQDTGTALKKVVDDSGEFAFTFVPGGTYTLRIEAKGFRPFAATGITPAAGQQGGPHLTGGVGRISE